MCRKSNEMGNLKLSILLLTQLILKQFRFAKKSDINIKLDANTHKQTEILTFTLAPVNSHRKPTNVFVSAWCNTEICFPYRNSNYRRCSI